MADAVESAEKRARMRIANWEGTPKEIHPRVISLVQQAHDEGCVAYLRFVAFRAERWRPLFGRIDLAHSGDLKMGPRYMYEHVATLAEVIPAVELNQRLESAAGGGSFPCDGIALEDHLMLGGWGASRHYAYDYCPWPSVVLQAQATSAWPGSIVHPLVSPDAPLFSDIEHLRAAIAEFRQDHLASDARRDRVLLIIWDYRGRIESLEYVAPTLSVKLNGSALAGMTLSGRVDTPNGIVEVRQGAEKEITVRLESEPRGLDLGLIAGYDLVDRAQEGPYSPSHASRLVTRGQGDSHGGSEALERLLQAGEHDTVEFKPWVNLATGGKRVEVLETSIAFANTRGGSIVVGVDRYGQPLGEDKIIREWKGRYLARRKKSGAPASDSSGEEWIPIYGTELRDFIQNSTNTRLEIQLIAAVVKGCAVLVLKIRRGREKPYATQPGNDIWIRVNATNRRPSPEELRELLTPQDVEREDETDSSWG